ncbi:MAG: hypothetical protein BZY81_06915 [SAR202 cluster bacterium Io17-Chloro-G4]|nr:MAG: hypothetical protein BZY81_06915 [SAR202 cluster bacterium Io17-Chloro-G4]
MEYKVISSDNHIDLTACPPDLWSSQAPAKWKLLVPQVEELENGLHCLFPESQQIIQEQLGGLPSSTQRKIVRDNVAKLYHLD